LFGDFGAKVVRKPIFKLTIRNENSHDISNDNGLRVVNFATFKNSVAKSTMFPHYNFHKYTWTSPEGKTDDILIEDGIQVYLMSYLSQGLTVILTTTW
jgi:hypothetical protein